MKFTQSAVTSCHYVIATTAYYPLIVIPLKIILSAVHWTFIPLYIII